MKHCIALMLLTLGLSACARAPSTAQLPAASAPESAAASPAVPAEAATPAPTPGGTAGAPAPVSAGDLTAAAKTQQEGSDTGTSTDSGTASLERVASLPAKDQLPAGNWVAGKNYLVLSPAQPTDAPPGKVEVVEVFWYGCPHCYALEPYMESWLRSKPTYVEFVRVPVMWADVHRAHARLFYTLQALGKLDQLHGKVFDQIHQRGDQLYVPGNPQATLEDQAKFAEANGISAADFTNAYNSFGVQSNLQKADDIARRYRIDSVPTLVIDGKYETDVQRAGGDDQLMKLINDLAASEKHLSG